MKGDSEMERTILHVDMNCFYASVEMLMNPALRGHPIAVCGSTEERHGIVLTRNEEAKRYGITAGMVNFQAKQACPGLIIIMPHYGLYDKYSVLARNLYREYTDLVEPYGADECWLDVTESRSLFGGGMQIAEQIRERVKREMGLTVSIGVSFNKTFAKLGSDMKKPDAITEITRENFREKIGGLPHTDMIYIGTGTARRLNMLGIHTIGELAAFPRSIIVKTFGPAHGGEIWDAANGLETAAVVPNPVIPKEKSFSHGTTCAADLYTDEEVARLALRLSMSLGDSLREWRMKAARVSVGVMYVRDDRSGIDTVTYNAKTDRLTRYPHDIAATAMLAFRSGYDWKQSVRGLTVSVYKLHSDDEGMQIDMLMDLASENRKEKIMKVSAELRSRFGNDIICPASLLNGKLGPAAIDSGIKMPGRMGA